MRNQVKFQKTVLVHLDSVYRAAFALSRRQEIAEDLTQITFMKAFQGFSSFKKGSSCKAWLITILRNTWIDQLRRKELDTCSLDGVDYQLTGPYGANETAWSDAHDLLENFGNEQVIAALQSLPDDQRLTLYLTDVEEMGHGEVAGVLGIAVGTVKSRTSRARAALREQLKEFSRNSKDLMEADDEPPEQRAV